jgi:chitinase
MEHALPALLLAASLSALMAGAATASAQPVELAAPYEYLGWGDPQSPVNVMQAGGVEDLTLAFMLSHGSCNPEWDGSRPLLGGSDEAAIEAIRGAGGDVDVSFGGWSGKKLGSSCKTVPALVAAYRKVIDAYSLKAIDIDIEHTEFTSRKTRARVIDALAEVQRTNPGIEISITMGTSETGPEKAGLSLISDAAAIGFQPSAWTVMPFDFGTPRTDMGHASIRSLEGLASALQSAYHLSSAVA